MFERVFRCESRIEARRQMWRWRMILVGSIIAWLGAIGVQYSLESHWVVELVEGGGGVVVLAVAVVFYFVNVELSRWEDEESEESDKVGTKM